jgi:hypothetical protein
MASLGIVKLIFGFSHSGLRKPECSIGKRNRAYEAAEIIEAFTGLERQLGSPDGDTLSSKPERRVPHQPK